MKPYYEDDYATIYHGDAREVLCDIFADAIVTDPPYGIGFNYHRYDDTPEAWYGLMNEIVPIMRTIAKFVVMPACVIARMKWWYAHHDPEWMIAWYKGSPGHRSHVGFNDWEPHLVWGKPHEAMHDYFSTPCGFEDNGHPCPKPIEWAKWLVPRAVARNQVLADPFMGSGTTLRAAKDLGIRSIGIEIDERYCEIAARRLGQEVMVFDQCA